MRKVSAFGFGSNAVNWEREANRINLEEDARLWRTRGASPAPVQVAGAAAGAPPPAGVATAAVGDSIGSRAGSYLSNAARKIGPLGYLAGAGAVGAGGLAYVGGRRHGYAQAERDIYGVPPVR